MARLRTPTTIGGSTAWHEGTLTRGGADGHVPIWNASQGVYEAGTLEVGGDATYLRLDGANNPATDPWMREAASDGRYSRLDHAHAGVYLPLVGGVLTGFLTLHADPTNDLHAATKQYVDNSTPSGGPFLPLTGGTLTGFLTLHADPTSNLHAATKAYVDAHVPSGGPFLPLAGGTMTGKIVLDGNPTIDLHAAPKQYVDAQDHDHATPIAAHAGVAGAHHDRYTDDEARTALGPTLAGYLPLSGGTMTGALVMSDSNIDLRSDSAAAVVMKRADGTTAWELLKGTAAQSHGFTINGHDAAGANPRNGLTLDRINGVAMLGSPDWAFAFVNGATVRLGPLVQVVAGQIKQVVAPTDNSDAATKKYVDDAVTRDIRYVDPVVAATTANITLSGLQTIDGVAVTAGQRVLVKDQTDDTENDFYLAQAAAWTRVAGLQNGDTTLVLGGGQVSTVWTAQGDADPIVPGTTNVNFFLVGSGSIGGDATYLRAGRSQQPFHQPMAPTGSRGCPICTHRCAQQLPATWWWNDVGRHQHERQRSHQRPLGAVTGQCRPRAPLDRWAEGHPQ